MSRFGATWLRNGRARFRLWAPGQRAVELELNGGAVFPMAARAGGWFEVEADCAVGDTYFYKLGSGEKIPDPASRAQAEDVSGPSVVVDPGAFVWRQAAWRGRPWHETVLYELHAGSFGGFAGLRAELGRLADLGITAVELMPVADFAGKRNWGYDGVLPYAPDRAYGTPDELRTLIDEAHERGLMMFLDVVYNHFGPEGNYLGLYAPQFFRDDIKTPWGAAIDFRRPEVRRFFIENAIHWVQDYRFDGLRFDAVHAIADETFLDEMAREVRASVGPDRHVHLVLENDDNVADHLRHGFDAQWNDDAHHVLHVLLSGEHDGYYSDYAARPAEQLARCLASGFAYQGDPSPYRKGAPRGTPSDDLAPTSFVWFLQNHDQIGNRPLGDRLASLADPQALRAATAMLLLAPGIPLLFMGEEEATRTPFQFFTDFTGDLATAVREGRRREFAGFKGFDGEDIPDPNAVETFERSRFKPEPEAEEFHRRLLELRRTLIVPRLPGTRSTGATAIGPAAVFAHWRMGDGAVMSIFVNLGQDVCATEMPQGRPIFATGGTVISGTLPGFTTLVFLDPPA
ncbi:MAG: malto-oligosyltrehalose trehalohydrolase [Proteobacteria bacterium]|nr:malto-oligosyltrehalose trehalohydrolase [Pseudomonadota bacterium]